MVAAVSKRCFCGHKGIARKPAGRQRCSAQAQNAGSSAAFDEAQTSAARRQLFNNISGVYDELNDALSAGQHRVWKRMAVQWTDARPGDAALDICCGSGDLALLLASQVGASGTVIGLDFAQDMLEYAAAREQAAKPACRVGWVQGDALSLPFDDATFNAVTMGYGLRNVTDIPRSVREVLRVLRPGGKAAILDFNNASNPVVDAVQRVLLEQVVVPAARQRGLAEEYEYLRPSIKAFPTGAAQERIARDAGFAEAQHFDVALGLMGCLVVRKAPLR